MNQNPFSPRVKSWLMIYQFYSIIFLVIRSIFEFEIILKKILNSLINSIKSVTWFEVRFSSGKIYKNIIMYIKEIIESL